MELRKSGKIAVGIIAALGSIGALHWFVFKDKAELFQAEQTKYLGTVAQYQTQGNAPRVDDIHKFRYESLKYKLEFWRKTGEMGFYFPDYYRDPVNVDLALQRKEFWDYMRKIEALRDAGEAGNGPQLGFLGVNGWRWSKGLPEQLVTQGIAVEDVMTQVRNENRLLRSLAADSQAFITHTQIYANLLGRLGYSEAERDLMKERFGPVVATLYTLNRIDQVMKALPAEFFPPTASEQARLLEMYDLFRIQWPADEKGNVNYPTYTVQMRELVAALETAKQHGIRAVNYVRTHTLREIRWTDPALDADAPKAEVAADAMFGQFEGMDFDMGNFDAVGDRFGGVEAAPEGELIGIGVPIEILTVGDNASTMSFLYDFSNINRPVELDAVRLRSEAAPNAPIQTLAYFNVIGYAMLAGLNIEEQVAKNINELTRELYDVAVRSGARELAVEDGIVRQDGGNYVLIPPVPTPWGGEQPVDQPPPDLTEEAVPGEGM